MSYLIHFCMAVFFTSLSYFLSDLTLFQNLSWWQPLIIGTTVVFVGAFVEKVGAPMWLIIFLPFPIGMVLLLSFFQWDVIMWLYTYLLTLVYYLGLHILLSFLFKFDSLLPAWKFHSP